MELNILKSWQKKPYFPAGVAIIISILSLLVWYNLKQLRLKESQQELEIISNSIQRELELGTGEIIASLTNLSNETKPEEISRIVQQFPSIQGIAVIAQNREINYLLDCECQDVVNPIILAKLPQSNQSKITPTFTLLVDERYFLIYIPQNSREFLVAIVNLEKFIHSLEHHFPTYYIYLSEQGKKIYESQIIATQNEQIAPVKQAIQLPETQWELRVGLVNTPNRIKQNILTQSVLIGGILSGALLGGTIYLLQKIEQQKEARNQAEEEIDRLFIQVEDLCCLADFNGYFRRLNPAWSKTLGYSESELLTNPYLYFIHPDDHQLTTEKMTKLVTGEETAVMLENRYRHADGTYRHLAWQATASLETGLIYAVARDITQQKQILLALEENQQLVKRIVNNLPVIIYALDEKGNFTLSDGQGLEYLYLKPIIGESVFTIYKDYPEVVNPISQVLEGNDRIWQVTVNGRVYLNKANPIRDEEGKVIGLSAIAYDLTEQQQLQIQLDAKEEFLSKIINTISDAILVVNEAEEILFFNPQALYLLGRSEKELKLYNLGLPIVNGRSTDIYLLRPNGGMTIAEMHVENIYWQNQDAYLVSLRDVTERKQAEEKLQKNEERLQSILGSLEDIVWSADPVNFNLIYINQAAAQIFGYSPQQLFNNKQLCLEMIHPEDREFVRNQLELVKTRGKIEFVYRILDSDNICRWMYSRSWAVYNSQKEIIRIDGIETDITAKKQAETDLQHRIFYDNLTSLPNRDFFLSHLEYICQTLGQKNEQYCFAVLILDLDEFKVVNDGLGHSLGDQLLQEIAIRLKMVIDPTDFIARLGGDEFGILLENASNLEEAIASVTNIQGCLEQPFKIGNNSEVFVKTSIGIAFSDLGSISPEMLMRNADTALNRAKAMGKNNYAIFNQEMHAIALNRLDRELDLRYALEHNNFVLHYQPIISLVNGKVLGFESLVRLQHPTQGLLFPGDFVTIAEETGLIVPIGLWIFRAGCEQLQKWHAQFPQYSKLRLNINLSARQFHHPNLITEIDEILTETKIKPEYIKLEITESLFMDQVEHAINLLQKLRDRNLRICIDDFGTGYSSLSYLHKFPVNTLKIDRSFVNGLDNSVESVQIIKIIINLAHSLGLDTVAEGIETKSQLEFLKSIGCDQGQGYLIAKPLSVEAAEAYLQEKSTT